MISSVKIVLVRPMYQENIGAVARAMKNMGLSDLTLVSPDEVPNDQARFRAMSAADIVENAKIVSSLAEAVRDVNVLFGTSRRARRIPARMLEARQASEDIAKMTREGLRTAIIFGREDKGLSNIELEKCDYHIYIDADEVYPVLNVAQAVQVICYNLFQAFGGDGKLQVAPARASELVLASKDTMDSLSDEFDKIVKNLGYIRDDTSLLKRRIRRFFSRIDLEKREADLFYGIFKKINKKIC